MPCWRAGRLVTPGGVDAHCHLDPPMLPPVRMADIFETGIRSAACGGTTTVIPFAAQAKGGSLKDAVADDHRRADGQAAVDYAFHLSVQQFVALTLLRGQVVWDGRQFTGAPGMGQFLPCARPEAARPRPRGSGWRTHLRGAP